MNDDDLVEDLGCIRGTTTSTGGYSPLLTEEDENEVVATEGDDHDAA